MVDRDVDPKHFWLSGLQIVILYFLPCPFSTFHVYETEDKQYAPISMFCRPKDSDIRLKVENNVDDVENVECKRAELHK